MKKIEEKFYEYCVQTGFIIRGISKPKDWSEIKNIGN